MMSTLAVDSDVLPRGLPEEAGRPGLDVEGQHLAVVLRLAFAGGDDLALLGLFLGSVGDDDPADALLSFVQTLDNDPVVEWSDLHACKLRMR